MNVGVRLMHDKAVRSAVDTAGAVAALQLVYYVVTSAPGCVVVAGSRTACEGNMIQVIGIGVPIMLIGTTWTLWSLGRDAALLGTLVIATGLYLWLRFGTEPGWGAGDPAALLMPFVAGGLAYAYMELATLHQHRVHQRTHPGIRA